MSTEQDRMFASLQIAGGALVLLLTSAAMYAAYGVGGICGTPVLFIFALPIAIPVGLGGVLLLLTGISNVAQRQ
jgi:hypothetical protein